MKKKTTFSIRSQVHFSCEASTRRGLRLKAESKDMSLSEFMNELVVDYLKKNRKEK